MTVEQMKLSKNRLKIEKNKKFYLGPEDPDLFRREGVFRKG